MNSFAEWAKEHRDGADDKVDKVGRWGRMGSVPKMDDDEMLRRYLVATVLGLGAAASAVMSAHAMSLKMEGDPRDMEKELRETLKDLFEVAEGALTLAANTSRGMEHDQQYLRIFDEYRDSARRTAQVAIKHLRGEGTMAEMDAMAEAMFGLLDPRITPDSFRDMLNKNLPPEAQIGG